MVITNQEIAKEDQLVWDLQASGLRISKFKIIFAQTK
jgi:hypothetical protein